MGRRLGLSPENLTLLLNQIWKVFILGVYPEKANKSRYFRGVKCQRKKAPKPVVDNR